MTTVIWADDGDACYEVLDDSAKVEGAIRRAIEGRIDVTFSTKNPSWPVRVEAGRFTRVVGDSGETARDEELGIPRPPHVAPDPAGPAGMHVVTSEHDGHTVFVSVV